MKLRIPEIDHIGGYLSVAAASEQSGYADRTIRYLCQTGAIRCLRFSGVLVIDRRSLYDYVAYRRRGADDHVMESE